MDDSTVNAPLLAPYGVRDGALVAEEAKRLLRLAGPLVASFVLRSAVQMVSLMFVGHLGELPLAGASLAASLANVTGFSFLTGMAGAVDTLCGQAFGARRYHLLGVYKQRAMIVLAAASIPIATLWACTEQILLYIGLDQDIAVEAGMYARWLIPSLFTYVPLTCHARFLQAQSIVLPVMASSAVAVLSHAVVCYVLVYKAGMGSKGAALSGAISYCINLVIVAFYVRLSGACKRTWTGFSMEAFTGLREFAKLALPSATMVCLEWWSIELLVLFSWFLPNPKLETSVLSICANTSSLLFTIPLGLGFSLSTRVSNELGAGQPQAARLAVQVVVCITLTVGFMLATILILLRNIWGYAYSSEENVVIYLARMLPILAVSFFIDGLNGTLSGVLTGCGRQKIGARVNLGAFYLVGIPAGVFFAFTRHLNGVGLWLGVVCGCFTKLVSLISIIMCTNWEKEVIRAEQRTVTSTAQAN